MTINELIQRLSVFDGEAQVIVQDESRWGLGLEVKNIHGSPHLLIEEGETTLDSGLVQSWLNEAVSKKK